MRITRNKTPIPYRADLSEALPGCSAGCTLGVSDAPAERAPRTSATLLELPLKTKATIRSVGGSRLFRRRLLELGLVPGTDIEVLSVAPLGGPLHLSVRGCRISIRRSEADEVAVDPCSANTCNGNGSAART